MTSVRVVIVGTGVMGATHAAGFRAIPGVEIVGVVSVPLARAKAFAKEYNTAAFATLPEALKAVRPHAVAICVPTHMHRAMVEVAARAGVHVFCEKPITRTLKDAEAIVKVVRKTGITLMVGHVLRYFPEFGVLRRLVQGGELGNPAVLRLQRGGKMPSGLGDWYADWKRSGGPLLDLVIHDFDWLRWTLGPVSRVHARAFGTPQGGAPQAYSLTLLRFKSGPIAHVEGSWGHDQPFRVRVEVAGSKALADYDSAHPTTLTLQKASTGRGLPGVAVPSSPLAVSPYQREDEAFVAAIRTGGPSPIPAEEGLEAIRISLAALDSARTGKAVTL
jgi:predicted dehydrogenase